MKIVMILMCVMTAASAVSFSRVVYEEWKVFKLQHGKRYDTELEEKYRMKIYAENKYKIAKHNQLFALGHASFTQRMNKYSDMSHREFIAVMNGYLGAETNTAASNDLGEHVAKYKPPANFTPPAQVDWRKEGAVTEVEDQNLCASCWAFSATGALEGQHYLRIGGPLVSLSEQNLIDCSRKYKNHGCKGGKMNNAFIYIRANRGVDTDSSYPYEAIDDDCRYNPHNAAADDAGYVAIPKNEWMLMNAVADAGPVSAGMHGALETFRHYAKGVYNDKKCSAKLRRNHAVLIVGYGRDDTGQNYWLVKNSWGRSWGMDGYAKIARNHGNRCGIASEASYPLVKRI